MTREEYGTDGNVYQMSISNGKEFSTCGDVVSREAITEHLKSIAETIDVKEIGGDYNTGFYDGLEFAIDFVITLPSVQPARPCENRMKYVQETVDCILNTCKSNHIADIAMRNAAKFVQNAIDGECPDFEEIPKAQPCEDAVRREAVIQAMYDLCDTGETLKENIWRDNPHIDAIIDMIENLPSVTPANSWIPVNERLPEKSGMYIVTEKVFSLVDIEHTGRFKRMTEQVEFCNGKWQRATRFYEIVAWMPLPEPYREAVSK